MVSRYLAVIPWIGISAILILSVLTLVRIIAFETLGLLEACILLSMWVISAMGGAVRVSTTTRMLFVFAGGLILLIWYVNPLWFIYVPAVGSNIFLFSVFIISLTDGREPIITQIAAMVRDDMSEDIRRYTRGVTIAWAIFFALISIESILLILFASEGAKLLFLNIINYCLVVVFFMAEFLLRKIRFRNYNHVSPLVIAASISRQGFSKLLARQSS